MATPTWVVVGQKTGPAGDVPVVVLSTLLAVAQPTAAAFPAS